MFQPDQDGIYARVAAAPARRLLAYGVLLCLGALVIYTTLTQPPALHWLIFMLVFGVAMLVLAERLRRATRLEVILTEDELRDSSGRVLARIEDVVSVSRGAFAAKPSNGFTLVTNSRPGRAWLPGLWWRIGRRVGVGGVTAAGQTRFMAEQIALRLKQR